MANAAYLQRGEALDYKNDTTETIPHGTVLPIGLRIGVTGCDILPGQIGSVHVCGVFRFKKTGTAAIQMGQTVYFDGTGITTTSGDTTVQAGYAAAPAAASDTEILVKING